mmetsp:Transcript_37797/g.55517  ORF Transcript_37797/g.55517 Transcript_37797/m.55517 type:complete len:117 (-) Transcript_37797:489-839(-)
MSAVHVSPQKRAQQLARCMHMAKASDGAVSCLSDYLRTLPATQVHRAWARAKVVGKWAGKHPPPAILDNLPPLKTEKNSVYWERRYVFHNFPKNSIGLHQQNRLSHIRTPTHTPTR